MTGPAIVLIGPMGAGKTSIGKRVAKQLGLRFADSDAAVVRAHGPIDRIFAEYGEPHFRELERAAVAEALRAGGVVALGGGAVLHPQTQRDLADVVDALEVGVVDLDVAVEGLDAHRDRTARVPVGREVDDSVVKVVTTG